ncbi:hypothetical protein GCM10011521_23930 [Arenimonas soli]|uniref:DUF5056 domain-containing protein n=1 Tax=Arenimonas soli TaxID=2269504 RepID=A0ABQ1HPD2_9GAMM|nr:hypothetical protein [Arenimonas soli]GGA84726.1 hypothetical protein GCM10011521_23930 [Arenimonas soli]
MTEHKDASDPQLDDLLRRNFPGAVADDGFSARVMRRLPPRRGPRPWLLPGAAVTGSLVAWLALMSSPVWQQVAQEWLADDFGAASAGIGVLLLGVTLVSCAWALEEG